MWFDKRLPYPLAAGIPVVNRTGRANSSELSCAHLLVGLVQTNCGVARLDGLDVDELRAVPMSYCDWRMTNGANAPLRSGICDRRIRGRVWN